MKKVQDSLRALVLKSDKEIWIPFPAEPPYDLGQVIPIRLVSSHVTWGR